MQNLIITAAGRELMAKMISGTSTCSFTKISASEHDYSGEDLESLVSLQDVKQTVVPSDVSRMNPAMVNVVAVFSNEEIAEAYYIRAIGLFAKDADDRELLYAVSMEPDHPDYMPMYEGKTISSVTYSLNIRVDNSAEVSLEVNPGLFALKEDLQKTDSEVVAIQEKLNGIEEGAQVNCVIGVKGNAEENYREGRINISPEDIGLGNVNDTADKDKRVASAVHLGMPRTPESPSDLSDLAKYPNGSLTVKEFSPVADVIPDLPSEAYYHTLIGQSADPNYATQLALGMTAEKIAYRMKYAGGWRPWREIVHSGNIGQQSVKRAAIASGIQSLQTDGVTEYPEGSYLIRAMFNGTGFKLVCKNGNSDASTYGVIADQADKAVSDGSGNVISNTYAKKSIYGDEFINLGGGLGERGKFSLSCGSSALASGWCAQAEGSGTYAPGECSHAEGRETTATNYASHVCGKHNKAMTAGGSEQDQIGDAFVIGNGRFGAKSNALRVTYTGNVLGTKAFQSSGADYAEFIRPWADGNPEGEDRVGYFVTIKEGFLEKAGEGDYIVGITSGNPSVVGNADEDYYWRYERDEFNRIVMEDAPELAQEKDEAGNPVFDGETGAPVMVETGRTVKNARMKLAEGYDPSMQDAYVPRAERPEWDYVGMVGVVPVRDDGTCMPGRFCRCGGSGVATLAPERGPDCFFVLERISDCVVSVILK